MKADTQNNKVDESTLKELISRWKQEIVSLLKKQLAGYHTPIPELFAWDSSYENLISEDVWYKFLETPFTISLGKWFPELRQDKELTPVFEKADNYYKTDPMVLFQFDPATYYYNGWIKTEYNKLIREGKLTAKEMELHNKNKKIRFTEKQLLGFELTAYTTVLNLQKSDIIKNIIMPRRAGTFKVIKSEAFKGVKDIQQDSIKNQIQAFYIILQDNIIDLLFYPENKKYLIELLKNFTISYKQIEAVIIPLLSVILEGLKQEQVKEDVYDRLRKVSLLQPESLEVFIEKEIKKNDHIIKLFSDKKESMSSF